MDDVQLSDRAQQIVRTMLRRRHPSGEYVWLPARDIARESDLPAATVAQILARLRGYDWVEVFREVGGGDQLYKFTDDGAVAAAAALAQATGEEVHHDINVSTMKALEATEPPAVLAAIRRALGWDANNRPANKSHRRRP